MNTQINIDKNGTTTLATAGKYCDRNIDVNVEVSGDSHYDAFWDVFQQNGERTLYRFGIAGRGWADEIFKPKYNIVAIGNNTSMFTYTKIADMKACLESCGVTLDLSKATNTANIFAYNYDLTTLPKIDLSSSTTNNGTFDGDSNLKTIDELVVGEKTPFSNGSFNLCSALENMIVTGTIGQNGFNVQWSTKLSKASIESIINALSSTTSGLSITISKTAKEAAFTDAEWSALIATKSNWTISLA